MRGECGVGNNTTGTRIANPASVNCISKGGSLAILKDPNGNEYGLCSFPNGSSCEEWALMRGECGIQGNGTIPQTICLSCQGKENS